METHNASCTIPCTTPGHTDHVHMKIDMYGYCECGTRVMEYFAGYRLPDRPSDETPARPVSPKR